MITLNRKTSSTRKQEVLQTIKDKVINYDNFLSVFEVLELESIELESSLELVAIIEKLDIELIIENTKDYLKIIDSIEAMHCYLTIYSKVKSHRMKQEATDNIKILVSHYIVEPIVNAYYNNINILEVAK